MAQPVTGDSPPADSESRREVSLFLMHCYELLSGAFGHRHWWPAETSEEVIIGAILTQNVSWSNVEKAIALLRQTDRLTLTAVQESSAEELAPLLRPTRFYNLKAKRLKAFVSWLFSNHDGQLDSMFAADTNTLRNELLTIPGLGRETVDSILLYAGGHLVFVVDNYTMRICRRLGLGEDSWVYEDYRRFFEDHLEPDLDLYRDYHAQIVCLGNRLCTKQAPACERCPLHEMCPAACVKPASSP